MLSAVKTGHFLGTDMLIVMHFLYEAIIILQHHQVKSLKGSN